MGSELNHPSINKNTEFSPLHAMYYPPPGWGMGWGVSDPVQLDMTEEYRISADHPSPYLINPPTYFQSFPVENKVFSSKSKRLFNKVFITGTQGRSLILYWMITFDFIFLLKLLL